MALGITVQYLQRKYDRCRLITEWPRASNVKHTSITNRLLQINYLRIFETVPMCALHSSFYENLNLTPRDNRTLVAYLSPHALTWVAATICFPPAQGPKSSRSHSGPTQVSCLACSITDVRCLSERMSDQSSNKTKNDASSPFALVYVASGK